MRTVRQTTILIAAHKQSYSPSLFCPSGMPTGFTCHPEEVIFTYTTCLQSFQKSLRTRIINDALRKERHHSLNPDAIIFQLSKGIMNPDNIVEEIEKQTGPIAGFNNLGQYRRDINNLILEIVLIDKENAQRGMTEGVDHQQCALPGNTVDRRSPSHYG
jgi:hypothetical protein